MPNQIITIKLAMANCYAVLHGDRWMLLDTGPSKSSDVLLAKLDEIGVKTLSLIVLTHSHYDHVGSIKKLKEKYGSPIIAGDSDVENIINGESPSLKPYGFKGLVAKLVSKFINITSENNQDLTILKIKEETSLFEAKLDSVILPIPGHTQGSIAIISGEDAFVGDLLMGGLFFPHVPCAPFFIYDKKQWRDSLLLLKEKKVKKLYLGHGGPLLMEHVVKKFKL